jgi:predicted metal-dependent hydrolase
MPGIFGRARIFGKPRPPEARQADTTELIAPPFPLPLPLELRRSARARRISLRVDMARGRIVLVAPRTAGRRQALDFLSRSEGWLRARLLSAPAPLPFVDGAIVPMLGIPHRVEGDSSRRRGVVEKREGVVIVPGAPEHLPRRLSDFLKAEARREIAARASTKAARLGRPIAALTLRDTRSRWGSCSRSGRIAFSWRLILAPDWVLDYVVAHEIAHLAEMNHGPEFWKLCASLTDTDVKTARAWLKRHGAELHAYG